MNFKRLKLAKRTHYIILKSIKISCLLKISLRNQTVLMHHTFSTATSPFNMLFITRRMI